MTNSHWELQEGEPEEGFAFASPLVVWGSERAATTHTVVVQMEVVDLAGMREAGLDGREVLGEHNRDDLLLAWDEIEANMEAFGPFDRLLVLSGLFIDPDAKWQISEQQAVAAMLVTLGQMKALEWLRSSALVAPLGNLMASTLRYYGLLPLDDYSSFRRLGDPGLWLKANQALPEADVLSASSFGSASAPADPAPTANVLDDLLRGEEWKQGSYAVTPEGGREHALRPLDETMALVRYHLLLGQNVTVSVARVAERVDPE